jgi:hypothetical protein
LLLSQIAIGSIDIRDNSRVEPQIQHVIKPSLSQKFF